MDIAQIVKERGGIRLDIACGAHKQDATWLGLDIQPLPGVDVVWDINVHPWPIPDDVAWMALASHIIEHIPTVVIDGGKTRFPFIEFMDEVWRIMKVGGQFAIAAPHGSSQGFLQDPTHCHALNETTFAYFDPDATDGSLLYNFYKPKPWQIKNLTWSPAANIEVVLVKREDIRRG